MDADSRMTIQDKCCITGEQYSVTVEAKDFFGWKNGQLIQQAFPYLTAGDREFLQTRISPKGWEQQFGKDEESNEESNEENNEESNEPPDILDLCEPNEIETDARLYGNISLSTALGVRST